MSPARQRALLVAILVLAAALRVTGLAWGLRHTPHWDERVFVENARAMVVDRSLDHRYYEYPALFFDLVAPVLALLPREALLGPPAYLVTRGIVATFSILSVGLVFVLGRQLTGPATGLAAALLLAVSPVEVITAHMVRPDVVLGSFALLGLLAFRRLGPDLKGDLVAGAAIGAATAVKFTGPLLAPSYVMARVLAPGPRASRIVLAGLVAVVLALALTPYALIHVDAYRDGISVQMGHHYKGRALVPSYLQQLGFYVGVIPQAFGPVGTLLLVVGLVPACREWRAWGPLLLYPATTLAVFASAEIHFERFLVPAAGVLALVAGRAVAALAERRPRMAAAVALLGAAFPLTASADYARQIARPSTKDQALDAVTEKLPAGARILAGLPELGLDPQRLEVVKETRWEPDGRLLARDADLVVWPAIDELPPELTSVAIFRSPNRYGGAPIALARIARPAVYETVPVPVTALSASENTGALPALVDGRLDTAWQTDGPQRPDEWIAAAFATPVTLARVTLVLGPEPTFYGEKLHLYATEDGTTWRRLVAVSARPPVVEQVGPVHSQVLLVDGTPARGVRIVQVGRRRKPWGAAELRIDALR